MNEGDREPTMKQTKPRSRRAKNTVNTKSGRQIQINRSFSDRSKAKKSARQAAKAAYLSTLPKNRYRRILYRLHPKRVLRYWFSRQGLIMGLKITGITIVVCFFLTIGLFAYFRKDLPKIKDLSGDTLGGTTVYYDRTGQTVLYNDYQNIKRIGVESKAISNYAKQATVAIEDKDFYKHGAFDVRGIMRAAFHDATGSSGAVQGGSTITQQLVKLSLNWTDNRTITRKVKELILATELEREYSKDDILTGYLNIAPYGGSEYGIEAAARDYFQTSAKDLTLAEAAMLAAIPQSPGYYSPYNSSKYNAAVTSDIFDQTALLDRQHYILDQMAKQGFITQKQATEAKKTDVMALVHPQASDKYQDIKAPYFVMAAKQQLEQMYGATTVNRGGWKVITTVDLTLQSKAEEIVANNIKNVTRLTGGLADEQATVVEDVHSGQIVALVGGVDFKDLDHGKINYASSVRISPGSTFKPYDYATLIDNNNNVGAGSVLYDSPTAANVLPGYKCTDHGRPPPKGTGNCLVDYDNLSPGPITLRYALGGSRNIPAVKAMYEAIPNDNSKLKVDSTNKVIATASAMMYNPYLESKHQKTYNCYDPSVDITKAGPNDVTQCYGASAIGDGAYLHLDDHVNGFATLARLGTAIPKTYILKITNAANKTIALPTYKPRQAIKADAAYIVDNMASDPNASYLPPAYKFQHTNGWEFAVKTGTTALNYDGLMASWSNKYAVVSWVGNHTRNVDITQKVPSTTMELLTEPITRNLMEAAHVGLKPDNWVQPATVKSAPAFVVRNKIHYGDVEPSPTNDLYPGWYVGGGNTKNSSQTLDKVSGKVATGCTPPLAKNTVSNSNITFWNIDIFNGGKQSIGSTPASSATSVATDDVHNCSDSPPTVTLTAPASCDTSCTITATVTQGTHPLSDSERSQFPGNIVFTLGGQTIHSENVSDSPSTISFTYNPTASGNGSLVATVTDSVLYQASSSANMAYSVPAASQSLTLSLSTHSGTSANFTWNDLGPGTVYNICYSGAKTGCTSFSSTSGSITGLVPGSYSATISSSGITSPAVTWTQ